MEEVKAPEGKRYQFGSGIFGEPDMGGFTDATDVILPTSMAALGIHGDKSNHRTGDVTGIKVEAIALQLTGRVNKTHDFVDATWILEPEQAGQMAGMFVSVLMNMSEESRIAFTAAMEEGMSKRAYRPENVDD